MLKLMASATALMGPSLLGHCSFMNSTCFLISTRDCVESSWCIDDLCDVRSVHALGDNEIRYLAFGDLFRNTLPDFEQGASHVDMQSFAVNGDPIVSL